VFTTIPDDQLKVEVDKWMQRIYTAHANLNGTAIQAAATGGAFQIAVGNESVTGSKTGIDTGLDEVAQVLASIDNGSTATNFWVTATIHPSDKSQIDLYVWKPTAAGNTTPIAATTAVTVRWLATAVIS
jgi:hypothetical protein